MCDSCCDTCMSYFDSIYSGRGGKHSVFTDEFNNETEIALFVSTLWAIK